MGAFLFYGCMQKQFMLLFNIIYSVSNVVMGLLKYKAQCFKLNLHLSCCNDSVYIIYILNSLHRTTFLLYQFSLNFFILLG